MLMGTKRSLQLHHRAQRQAKKRASEEACKSKKQALGTMVTPMGKVLLQQD